MVVQIIDQSTESLWQHTYGYYELGSNSTPHYGKLIRYYRKKNGSKVEDIARELGVKPRTVYDMEEASTMPTEMSRRAALARLLHIPPAIFALSTPWDMLTEAPQALHSMSILDPEIAGMYEENLKLAWSLYYTYSAQLASNTLTERINHLSTRVTQATGIAQDQLLALKCRFLQLDAVGARDRLSFDYSLKTSKEAIMIAEHLGNVELLAATLFRRARTYMMVNLYDLAVKDLERALPCAKRSRDPLRSYVKICLAEAYSLQSANDPIVQKHVRTLLDEVGRTLRTQSVLEDDGSYTRVDIAGWSMECANIYGRLGKNYLERARDALDIARDELGPQWTRWQGNLEIADANLSLLERDVSGCCAHIQIALPVVIGTGSKSNTKKIVDVYDKLDNKYSGHSDVQEIRNRLDELGLKKRGA